MKLAPVRLQFLSNLEEYSEGRVKLVAGLRNYLHVKVIRKFPHRSRLGVFSPRPPK